MESADTCPRCPDTGSHGLLALRVDITLSRGERMHMAAEPAAATYHLLVISELLGGTHARCLP